MGTNENRTRPYRKYFTLSVALVIVASLVAWGYGAIFLNVSNTATVNLGANLTGFVATSTTNCATVVATSYTTTPTIDWGSVITGTTASAFLCVHNGGTDAYPVSVTSSLLSTQGTITTPQAGQSIPAVSGTLLVELDWAVHQGAPLGPTTFSISFQ